MLETDGNPERFFEKVDFEKNQRTVINPKLVCLCSLLIMFPSSLDPDQVRQNVGPDLDPNCLTFGKVHFEKNQQMIQCASSTLCLLGNLACFLVVG